ncbi:RluA family pseudouridine synthase [Thiohalocapsa marina]|uniref:RluA family pseudouridine synthase n=1 Tax=Thiohalocapsa marina TaxID=424902 RepID=UPI0036DC1155
MRRASRPRLGDASASPESAARNGPTGVQQVQVPAALAGQRLDNFLLQRLKGVPRSLVYKLLRRGEVRVNKGRAKPSQRLAAGDWVRLPPVRQAETASRPAPATGMLAALADAVLYEDARVLVVNKPAGMAVHGGSGISNGVIEALRALRPGAELELVHRLDRDTSGCLLISKRRSALRELHRQMREGEIRKRYQALLAGTLPRATVEVTAPLRKYQLRGGERLVQVDTEQGKPARTVFRRVRAYGGLTLVDVDLYTGRTHQIRVHAASIGAPVAGDDKYGDAEADRALRQVGLKRLFLHAAALSFTPAEGAPQTRVEAPLPTELTVFLQRLEEQDPIHEVRKMKSAR